MEETINGKYYPIWQQFVDRKYNWISGVLEDSGDSMDRRMNLEPMSTKITDIVLRANGKDSAYFEVIGEDFSCGFDVQHGGISGEQCLEEEWIGFSGYGEHSWRIKMPERHEK